MKEIYLSFTLHMRPIPQPRPKASRVGGFVRMYTPNSAKINHYKSEIRSAFLEAYHKEFPIGENEEPGVDPSLFERPLNVVLDFYFKDPNPTQDQFAVFTPHTKKPDLDNLAKTVLDALNGVAWHDDSKVVDLHLRKSNTCAEMGGKSGRKLISTEDFFVVEITYLVPR